MKTVKENRLERKKKKVLALLELIQSNREQEEKEAPIGKKSKTETEQLENLDYASIKGKCNKAKKVTLRIKEFGENASLNVPLNDRQPLFLNNIQNLILYSQLGVSCPYKPKKWVILEKPLLLKHTNLLLIENMSLYDYSNNESIFSYIGKNFDIKLEVISSAMFKSDLVKYFATIPLSRDEKDKFIVKYGNLKTAEKESSDIFDFVHKIFPQANHEAENNTDLNKEEVISRTELLANVWQMLKQNYPLPIKGLMERQYPDFILSKDEYQPVTSKSPMYGIDCEMCMTTNKILELTRVTIVNEEYKVIYDELVKPYTEITNYLTAYSGITAAKMKNVTKRIEDVQNDIKELLPGDAILVGHSLENDLIALKLMHPYNIDTSMIYNLTGSHHKPKLKTLMYEFFKERIQQGGAGHCSEEDSAASLRLTKLKMMNGLHFGDAVILNKKILMNDFEEMAPGNYAISLIKAITSAEKKPSIVTLNDMAEKYEYYTYKNNKTINEDEENVIKGVASNNKVIKETIERMNKYSLNIAHLKLSEEELSKMEETCKNVDNWVAEICTKSKLPSLNIILFTGHDKSSGCCFIKVKS